MVAADDVVRVLFTDAYAAAAPIFACYASLGLLRIAAYGTLIVSAGAPRFVLHAALLSLVSNLTLSVLFLETLGFIGPALGAAVAFLLTIVFYCWCIGRALGVSGLRVFPYRGYLRVFGVAVLSALVAVPIKLWFDGPIGLRLTLELVAVLGMYALLGTLLRVIQSADWRFAADWLRLRVARR
jgi:O-antigen/teichoic acid export membrane protein